MSRVRVFPLQEIVQSVLRRFQRGYFDSELLQAGRTDRNEECRGSLPSLAKIPQAFANEVAAGNLAPVSSHDDFIARTDRGRYARSEALNRPRE
jgi:hypothetical protein